MEGTAMVIVPEHWLNEISEKLDLLLQEKPSQKEPEKVMTAEEAAEYLQINRNTIYQWARQGKIPCRKVGSKVYFSRSELDDWARREVK